MLLLQTAMTVSPWDRLRLGPEGVGSTLPACFLCAHIFRMSIVEHIKSKRGRPSVDSEIVRARMERGLLVALDAWIAAQPDPKPSRPEAVRRIVSSVLMPGGK